jgi:hypothetical protein
MFPPRSPTKIRRTEMARRKKTPVKRKKVMSAADELEATPSRRTGPRRWFESLDGTVQKELLYIRERFQLNACGGKSVNQVRQWCQERWGFRVGRTAFTDWIREKP